MIFCRNVLIYFDQDTKTNIFGRLSRAIEADGFMVLVAAETVVGLTEAFKPVADRRGLYRPGDARVPLARPRGRTCNGAKTDRHGRWLAHGGREPGHRLRHLQPWL